VCTVDRGIQENAWPWLPFADDIDTDVNRQLEALCSRFEVEWLPVEAPAIRKAAAGELS
jgi:hypothetical protein